MNQLLLHNTLTGRKEPFTPMVPGNVGMYVCGITPYDETHLGHARAYVTFDLLKRALQKSGYRVTHVQNFTDVDDKIIARALERGQSPAVYAEPFIQSFTDLMSRLSVLPADHYPRVTTHMPDIVNLIQKLITRDYAYVVDRDVYYSVRRFGDAYGRLSKRNIDELEVGARVEKDERKKDPLDFALWKSAKPGEPSWESPWGAGRPGWHIECSAMSMKYLGEEFDIHGGGMDLIFPHHTNEIAQSVGATGKPFARVWVHNGFVNVDNEKMSKSLGNFFTLKDIFAKFDPMVVRYFLLSQHYRSPLNFSDQALKAAESAWRQRIMGAYRLAKEIEKSAGPYPDPKDFENLKSVLMKDFVSALTNDLNTPMALAELNDLCSEIYSAEKTDNRKGLIAAAAVLEEMFEWLGLKSDVDEKWDDDVLALVQEREEARRKKDWAGADRVRLALKSRGVTVEDTAQGPRLRRLSP